MIRFQCLAFLLIMSGLPLWLSLMGSPTIAEVITILGYQGFVIYLALKFMEYITPEPHPKEVDVDELTTAAMAAFIVANKRFVNATAIYKPTGEPMMLTFRYGKEELDGIAD